MCEGGGECECQCECECECEGVRVRVPFQDVRLHWMGLTDGGIVHETMFLQGDGLE